MLLSKAFDGPSRAWTKRTKQVLERAAEEKLARVGTHLGLEAVLLGLLWEHDGVAVWALENLRVAPGQVRKEVEQLLRPSA